jgi:methyl-accepting chemotaxis protein
MVTLLFPTSSRYITVVLVKSPCRMDLYGSLPSAMRSSSNGEAPESPGTLPRPGTRRDGWAARTNHVTNAETTLALDLQSFGLQNAQLQHALSSMLKAIVSLSEDHKVVKAQLEAFQNGTRDSQTALALELDFMAQRLNSDFVGRKEWTEGRYEDQRRTDRVATNLHEFQQEQFTGMTSALPRLAFLEATSTTVAAQIKDLDARAATKAELGSTTTRLDERIGEVQTLVQRQTTALERDIGRLRDDTNADSAALKRAAGELNDSIHEMSASIARHATGSKQQGDAIALLREDVTLLTRSLAEKTTTFESDLHAGIKEAERSCERLRATVESLRKVDDERITKAENHFLFNVASFETVTHEQGLKLRGILNDVESLKGEVAALNFNMDNVVQRCDERVSGDRKTREDMRVGIDQVSQEWQQALAAMQKQATGATEQLRAVMDNHAADVANRLKAIEVRKKADDQAFRDLLLASVSDEVAVAVRDSENKRITSIAAAVSECKASVQQAVRAIDEVRERTQRCEDVCESAVATIDQFGNVVAEATGRVAATQHDIELLACLLNAELPVLRRLTSGDALADQGRDAITRYQRTLPWASRPSSPVRQAARPATTPANEPDEVGRPTAATARPSDAPLTVTVAEASLDSAVVPTLTPALHRSAAEHEAVPSAQRRDVSPPRPASSLAPARRKLGIDINNRRGAPGVVVVGVEPGGVGDVSGLTAGDVISHVGGYPVTDKDDFKRLYLCAPTGEALVLTLIPGGRSTAQPAQLMLLP